MFHTQCVARTDARARGGELRGRFADTWTQDPRSSQKKCRPTVTHPDARRLSMRPAPHTPRWADETRNTHTRTHIHTHTLPRATLPAARGPRGLRRRCQRRRPATTTGFTHTQTGASLATSAPSRRRRRRSRKANTQCVLELDRAAGAAGGARRSRSRWPPGPTGSARSPRVHSAGYELSADQSHCRAGRAPVTEPSGSTRKAFLVHDWFHSARGGGRGGAGRRQDRRAVATTVCACGAHLDFFETQATPRAPVPPPTRVPGHAQPSATALARFERAFRCRPRGSSPCTGALAAAWRSRGQPNPARRPSAPPFSPCPHRHCSHHAPCSLHVMVAGRPSPPPLQH